MAILKENIAIHAIDRYIKAREDRIANPLEGDDVEVLKQELADLIAIKKESEAPTKKKG